MSLQRLESTAAEAAVLCVAETMLDDVTGLLEDEEIDDTHDLYDLLGETACDDTLAMDLSLDEQLDLAEEYADDYGFDLGKIEIRNLRSRIGILAMLVIYQLGLERAHNHLSTLFDEMDDQGVPISQLLSHNPHGWARHYAEREEEPFQIYEYRNLEGEQIHIDLYAYYGVPGHTFYFEVHLEPEDVSSEENNFDAS